MIKSMTGYGRGENSGATGSFTVEIRSVNHRFLETVVRMPRIYSALEDFVKKTAAEKLARGRVDIFISLEKQDTKNKAIKVDKELAQAYYNSLKELGEVLGIADNVQLSEVARFPEVVSVEEVDVDLDEVAKSLGGALEAALQQLVEMRAAEGSRLKSDLEARADKLEDIRQTIDQRAPGVVVDYKEKLKARINELLDNVEVDESRLATEVAFFADRSNVTEELIRLQSHLVEFKKALNSAESIGRKLDFLVQEMNREVNTIGSKANDLNISALVIDAKSEIEKIREQVQNIE